MVYKGFAYEHKSKDFLFNQQLSTLNYQPPPNVTIQLFYLLLAEMRGQD